MSQKCGNFRCMAIDSPLRRWRRARGYSQERLAALCGVQTNTVQRWEQAKRGPRGVALARLMAITGLSADALLFPTEYLREHPEFLSEWAETPRRRGPQPRRRQPPEEGK
jgi:transcriptional regulator with XRE-family HTH domain